MLKWTLKATPIEHKRNVLTRIIYIFAFSLLLIFIDPIGNDLYLYFLIFVVVAGSFMYANLPYGTKYFLRDDGIVINDLSNRKVSNFYAWKSLKNFQVVNSARQISGELDKANFEGMDGKVVAFLINQNYVQGGEKRQIVLMAPKKIEDEVTVTLRKYISIYHYVIE